MEILGLFAVGCFMIHYLYHISFWLLFIGIPIVLLLIPYTIYQIVSFFNRLNYLKSVDKLNMACLFNFHDDVVTEAYKGEDYTCIVCKRKHYKEDLSYLSRPFNSDTY